MAAFYLISLALGVLIVSLRGSSVDLMHVLFGTVLALNDEALTLIALIAGVTLLTLAVFWRALVAECLDPLFLRSVSRLGTPVHFIFLGLVVLNLVGGFQALGTLLSVGLMMLPAAAARFWTTRVGTMCAAGAGDRLCLLRRRPADVLPRVAALRAGDHPVGRRRLSRLDRLPARAACFARAFAITATAPPDPPRMEKTMHRSIRLAAAMSVITFAATSLPAAAEPLKVVASFSIIGDFAKNVGGDRIELTTLVGPDGDAHVYEPKPPDAVAMAGADVVLVNGLHFEGFLQRLVEASATKAPSSN